MKHMLTSYTEQDSISKYKDNFYHNELLTYYLYFDFHKEPEKYISDVGDYYNFASSDPLLNLKERCEYKKEIWDNHLDIVLDIALKTSVKQILKVCFYILKDSPKANKFIDELDYRQLINLAHSSYEPMAQMFMDILNKRLHDSEVFDPDLMIALIGSPCEEIHKYGKEYFARTKGIFSPRDTADLLFLDNLQLWQELFKKSALSFEDSQFIDFVKELINRADKLLKLDRELPEEIFQGLPLSQQRKLHGMILDSPVSKVYSFGLKELDILYGQKIPEDFIIQMLEHTALEVKAYISDKIDKVLNNLEVENEKLFIYYVRTLLLMPNKLSKSEDKVYELIPKFALLKMQEYGFWPKDLPTPYERQINETEEEYEARQKLIQKYGKLGEDIAKLYEEKDKIKEKLGQLRKEYDDTWDIEKIRKDVARKIMEESKARRAERKKQRQLENQQRSEAWNKKKEEEILFIGKGYSQLLQQKESDDSKLKKLALPLVNTDRELAALLDIEYAQLRFISYHRDVVTEDHYHRYSVPKRKGGYRNIAAPKPILKKAQRRILEEILCKLTVSDNAHGFLKGRSVVSSAKEHEGSPDLVINMDLEDFFPTVTFERVRGMFKSFGYSGYISSLLAMICTYCERMPIEVKGQKRYVKTSSRILPQGSPASPMITNILCIKLDKRLNGLADKYNFTYTRYADDMSFSLKERTGHLDHKLEADGKINLGSFCVLVSKIVSGEGFKINKSKTRFLKAHNRQCITGIVVNNEELGVPKKWVKILRAAIHNGKKEKAKGQLPQETIRKISGMAAWLKSVNAERYKDIISEAYELIKS